MTILSVSRRTDIPAFYGDWFRNRLREGYCLVPNPFNPRQVSHVSLHREAVDAFVFWTRNPAPFSAALDELDDNGYPYVVLFTLTGYPAQLEPFAPPTDQAIAAMEDLFQRVGPERIVWRYDPIIFGPGLEPADHVSRFRELASRLAGLTTTVKTSFLDLYQKTRRRLAKIENGSAYVQDPAGDPRSGALLEDLARIAADSGITIETCAEPGNWSSPAGSCIDAERLNTLFDLHVKPARDRGQRSECRCAESRDIGMNESCLHGCVYCYATRSHDRARLRHHEHDPECASLFALKG